MTNIEEYASVWDVIADTPQEAAKLRIRADAMHGIAEIITARGWTQAEAAKNCGLTRPRLDDLLHGKITKFQIDDLIDIATTLGCDVHVNLIECRKENQTQRIPLSFQGDSCKRVREFPNAVQNEAGWQLDKVQQGGQPNDFSPMPSIGPGVEELRVWDDAGNFRVIYFARLAEAVYVLHAFHKKTQRTVKHDIDIAKKYFAELMRGRK